MLYFQEVHAQHRAVSAMLMFGLRIKIKAGSVSALELYKSLTSPISYIRVQWAMLAMVARLNASLQSLAGWGASDGLRFELLRLAFETLFFCDPFARICRGCRGHATLGYSNGFNGSVLFQLAGVRGAVIQLIQAASRRCLVQCSRWPVRHAPLQQPPVECFSLEVRH